MDYSKIIAVSGLQGLHELISSKNDGAIVRSLDDKTTKFVSSRIHNFSHLESIEIYTVRDNVNLVDILQAMQKSGETLPDAKDNAGVKSYFEKVYPDLDFDRVYSSDMKKIVKWFEILQKNDIEIKLSAKPEEEPVAEEVEQAPAAETEKPVKTKSKAKAKETLPETPAVVEEEAPKKKAAAKKKEPAAEKETTPKKSAAKAKPAKEEAAEPAAKKKAAPKKK